MKNQMIFSHSLEYTCEDFGQGVGVILCERAWLIAVDIKDRDQVTRTISYRKDQF